MNRKNKDVHMKSLSIRIVVPITFLLFVLVVVIVRYDNGERIFAACEHFIFAVITSDEGTFTEPGELDADDLEKTIMARLERDRGLCDNKFPFVIYFNKVKNGTYFDVEFMRRNSDNQSFDLVGTASEAKILLDIKTRQMHFCAKQLRFLKDDVYGTFESQIWPIELPTDLSFFARKPSPIPSKETLPLTLDQRAFLAGVDYPYRRNQIDR